MGIYADEDSAVTAAAPPEPAGPAQEASMTEGSLITDVRELSSRASVIDLKGDVTASSEKALADAYTRPRASSDHRPQLQRPGVHEQWRDRDAGDAAGAGQPPAPAPGRLRAERALPADLRADPPGRGDRHLRHRGRGVRRGTRPDPEEHHHEHRAARRGLLGQGRHHPEGGRRARRGEPQRHRPPGGRPVQGFGKMWQKTMRVELGRAEVSPAEVISTWKAEFQRFWPERNWFYAPRRASPPARWPCSTWACPAA